MANQALWRRDPATSKGMDATLSYDWSPSDVNPNDTHLTAGLRFNEPIPVTVHNTVTIGYVRNHISSTFVSSDSVLLTVEHGLELNALVDVARLMLVQPVLQYFANVGGAGHRGVVFGLRTKIEF